MEKKLTFEADRLAGKLKTLETENVLLKDALHKLGTAAQGTNIWLKLDAFRFRCMEMVSCAGCPVRKNKAARDLCFRPCQEFTEAELDTLLACFDNASKEEANAKDETEN